MTRGPRLVWVMRFGGLLILPLLIVAGVDLASALDIVRQANAPLVLVAITLTAASVLLRAWRWRVVARACGVRYSKYVDYLRLHLTGLFAGTAVPQAAAVFAPVLFVHGEGGSWRRAAVSILVDRSLEMALLVGFALWGAFYLFPLFPAVSIAVFAAAGAIGAAGTGALVLGYCGRRRRANGNRLPAPIARFLSVAEIEQWGPTAKALGKRLGPLALASLVILTLQVSVAASLTSALGLEVSPVFLAATYSLVLLVTSLPVSVLGLGPREGILVAVLTASSVTREEALALGVLLSAVALATRLPGAVPWFWRWRASAPAPAVSD